MSEAQKRAMKKYREKIKSIKIEFSPAEADLFEHIEAQPSKRAYIKALIRNDMNKDKEKE